MDHKQGINELSERALSQFKTEMTAHIDAMEYLVDVMLANAGDTSEESVKVGLNIAIGKLEHLVNGTDAHDMRATKAELSAQLEEFCKKEGVGFLSADDLISEHPGLGREKIEWLEHFIRRWNAVAD